LSKESNTKKARVLYILFILEILVSILTLELVLVLENHITRHIGKEYIEIWDKRI